MKTRVGAYRAALKVLLVLFALMWGGIHVGAWLRDCPVLWETWPVPLWAALAALPVLAYGLRWRRTGLVHWMLAVTAYLAACRVMTTLVESRALSMAATSAWAVYALGKGENSLLCFYQAWLLRQGYDVGGNRLPRPVWPVLALLTILVALPDHGATLAALSVFLLAFVMCTIRRGRASLVELVRDYGVALFILLAYPDRRYRASGGLWIPDQSICIRELGYGRLICPLYAAAIIDAEVLALRSAPDWLSLAAGAVIVILIFNAALFAFHLEPLIELRKRIRASSSDFGDGACEWERCALRVSHSRNIEGETVVSEHLFLGFHPDPGEAAAHPFKSVDPWSIRGRTPVLLHRSILDHHGYLCGQSGRGKTSLGLIPLLIMLMRGADEPKRDLWQRTIRDARGRVVWEWSAPRPTLIVDLKGDMALFNTARIEAKRRGQTFRYFRLERGYATAYFNVFKSLDIQMRPVIEFTELTLQALNLFHGDYYGASFYSKANRDRLLFALEGEPNKPNSWRELYELVLRKCDRQRHRDTLELLSTIYALAHYDVLGPAPPGIDTIHMPSVIANCECVYFCLPARLHALSARDIAKLALYCFLTAAAEWNDAHGERRCYCIIDEFQAVASQNMAIIFQQATGANVSFILANQDPNDLDVRDAPNLRGTVFTNTRFKQFFSLTDPDVIETMIKASGEEKGILKSVAYGRDGRGMPTTTVTEREVVHTVLNQNMVNAISDAPNDSLIWIVGGAGYTQYGGAPAWIRTPYPMLYAEYVTRKQTAWPQAPRPTDGTQQGIIVNQRDPKEIDERAHKAYAQLEALYAEVANRPGRKTMT